MHPGILVQLLCASSNYLRAPPPPTLGRQATHLVPAPRGKHKSGVKGRSHHGTLSLLFSHYTGNNDDLPAPGITAPD